MSDPNSNQSGIIAWFANNSVAANLMMFMILTFGIVSAFTIQKQTTPDIELKNIQVRVPYPGAAPQEVEEGVVIKIEEAVQDVEGIEKIRSVAREGIGTVTIEVENDFDLDVVLANVKTRIDAISTFPGLTEKPVIAEQLIPIHVVFLSIYGDMNEFVRKALSQQVRDDLLLIPSVNDVQILGDRAYEISIEVSEATLRKYSLTMAEVAQAISSASVDLPGGEINTSGGNILLRTEGQVYTGTEFGELLLRTYPDGSQITIGDIATIRDGFVESDEFSRFDNKPAILLRVMASGDQNELETAADVRKFIAKRSEMLPDNIKLDAWIERSH